MLNERTEIGATGKQNRVVVQAKQSATRYRTSTLPLIELNQDAIIVICTELDGRTAAIDDSHADYGLVVLNRPLEIGHLQPHAPDMRFGRKPVTRRGYSVTVGHRFSVSSV
jgi:hypothetical protein